LSLGGALSEATHRLEGPLQQELSVAEERVRLGVPRQQALAEVAERLELRDLTTLVTLLNQTESLGTGVTKAVEAIARRLRTGRVLAAERRAGEAPIKMLFPLVFCLFPSILVLLVGPVLLGRGALFGW
jgi:tight adherence protein C